MRRNLRPYGYVPTEPAPLRRRGLRSPRFIAGVSLVLALMAVALSIVALVLALNAPGVEDEAVEDMAVEPPWVEPSERTMAMVDEAVRRYETEGWAETAEYYLSPWSVDGTWHVFMVSPQDRFLASQDQSLLGKGIKNLGRDYWGNNWGDIEITEGGRWVHQHSWHPVTGWPTVSHTWVVRHDGYVFGSVWYE